MTTVDNVAIPLPTLETDQKALYALSNYIVAMLNMTPDVLLNIMTQAQYSLDNDNLAEHEEVALEALTGAGIEFAYSQGNEPLVKILDPDGLLSTEYKLAQ